ncbi:helix-turn-helix domain-containing protein [Butyricicoccus sp.]|uniref:helix-turn-helix domain-containing protein n=1 Tax=Butyricicoccus sp. TaxID=2049021 RepID=UPI003F15B8FA
MPEQILAQFGLAVRNLRLKKEISQEQLAERSLLHRTYISDIELGKRNISLENISKIAIALNMPISDLFVEVEKYESIR